MSKKTISSKPSNVVKPVFTVDPTECPFREYRDNELQPEFWGMGPSCFRAYSNMAKGVGYPKPPPDYVWADEQTQPLPRSVRQYLNGYVRAEDLARNRWEADVVVSEEINGEKMSLADIQLSHAQVLTRSSFCRSVLSACFMLERADNYTIEHQWEGFSSVPGPEGWRAKYHIYSPGIKPGGGAQHRPTLSKNGCYMVRLFYLGAWRCVWVSDQVPVDATEAPLLPFSPLLSKVPPTKPGTKPVPTTVTSNVVYLWPLLICKALLKLAAPDMSSDESSECVDDEIMAQFDIMHCLTGAMSLNYNLSDSDLLWELITSEVPVFSWDDDEDTQASTVKSKSTRKPTNKDVPAVKKSSIMYVVLHETKHLPPYHLPGITPGFEMTLLISMARDLPLKKPLPEPEIALWKTFRWVDWARNHGLYSAYECPRTRFLKVNGLLKLSFAPHLLDVQSTESITVGFVKAEIVTHRDKQASKPRDTKTVTTPLTNNQISQIKEEFREWILYEPLQNLIKTSYVLYSPSTFEYTSAVSTPPVRVTKGTLAKHLDIVAPKTAPLYLQIDGPDVNKLRISMNVLHPRVLANSGVLIEDYIEGSYLFLESFEWFKDSDLPKPKAFIRTRGYGGVEVTFPPGRHVCRIWVHSRMNWHMMLLSESSLLLGTRDHIQCAAVRDCPWASKYLTNLSNAFINWIKIHRSNIYLPSVQSADREFFRSYHPDLPWDKEVVGYDRSQLHWMFRQALQSHLFKRLLPTELSGVFTLLRKCFCDPDFGFKEKPVPTFCLKTVAASDPCDCQIARHGDTELVEEEIEEIEEVFMLELDKGPDDEIAYTPRIMYDQISETFPDILTFSVLVLLSYLICK